MKPKVAIGLPASYTTETFYLKELEAAEMSRSAAWSNHRRETFYSRWEIPNKVIKRFLFRKLNYY